MSDFRPHLEASAVAKPRATPTATASWSGAALGVFAIAAAAAWLLLARSDGAHAEPELPTLPEPAAECGAPAAMQAARGHDAVAVARAKIARYPFAPADGIAALALLREAERCFELAGDHSSAKDAASHARSWRARVQSDSRDHWLRYRVAVASGRAEHALPDVEFLLELFERTPGPFTTRLRRAQIELSERHDREEK